MLNKFQDNFSLLGFFIKSIYFLTNYFILNFLLISFFLSLSFYLDLSSIANKFINYKIISLLITSLISFFIIKKLINPSNLKLSSKVTKEKLFWFVILCFSYFYYSAQFFSSKFFNVITLGTDAVIHRLIAHELLLNLNNGFQLVHRNTTSGGIDYTDIFYPLGFHAFIFYLSNLVSIPVDTAIFIFFLIIWLIVLPVGLTIFVKSFTKINSTTLFILILFFNTSEIFLQYFVLGLWPFLTGFVISFHILYWLNLHQKFKFVWFIFLLIVLFNIYPSFAFTTLLILLILNFQRSYLCARNFQFFILLIIPLFMILLYFSKLYVNVLIVLNSVFLNESFANLSKFYDLNLYFNQITMRFFYLNSSRWIIIILILFSLIFIFTHRQLFQGQFRLIFIFLLFSYSLILSLISGIIGPLNYLLNPLGSLFYFDFNRLYALFYVFALLLIAITLEKLDTNVQKFLLFLLFLPFLYLQFISTFTSRINTTEIPKAIYLSNISSKYHLSLNLNNLVTSLSPETDHTFLRYTYLNEYPVKFNSKVNVNSRTSYY